MGLASTIRRRLRRRARPAFTAWDACLPDNGRGRFQQPVPPPEPFAAGPAGTVLVFPRRPVSADADHAGRRAG